LGRKANPLQQFSAMKRQAPEPLNIQWKCKSIETAHSGYEILADGRIHCWIEHDVIRGVTPQMLVWWFKHLEGDVDIEGQRLNRYRVWHPRDHIAIEYSRRNPDGSIGVGCVIHLTEMLGANPDYLIDVHTEIVKLDEQGFAHRPRFHGFRLARMDYEFRETDGGTIYRNSLTVGAQGILGKLLNRLIRAFVFNEARGRAWIKHNIEEVGNFETFLPKLYAAEGRLENSIHRLSNQPLQPTR
jgi:DAPG hydrolase PhiG domain